MLKTNSEILLSMIYTSLFEGQSYHSLPPGTFNSRLIVHFSISNSPKINEKYGDVGGDGIKGQLGLNYQKAVLEGLSPTVFRKIHLGLDESGLEDFTFKFIADTWETSRAALLNKT